MKNSTSLPPTDTSPGLPPETAKLKMPAPSVEPAAGFTSLPDLDKLKLRQDFQNQIGVRKAVVAVPVRKPDRQSFVRTFPDEGGRLTTAVLEDKDMRETYLVDPSLWEELADDVVPKVLVTTVNRRGDLSLWPIRMPGADGRIDDWNRSALEAANRAQRRWVRVSANMAAGMYDVFESTADLGEPTWGTLSFDQIVAIAFKDRFITKMDHPVLRRLRGEI